MKTLLLLGFILMSTTGITVNAGLIYYPDGDDNVTCLTDAKGKIISCDRKK